MNFYATTPQMVKFRTIVIKAPSEFEAIENGTDFLERTMGLGSDIADEIIGEALCMRTLAKV